MTSRDNQLMLIGRVLENPALLNEYNFDHFDPEFRNILVAMQARVEKKPEDANQAAVAVWFKAHCLQWGKSLKQELVDWLKAHAERLALLAKAKKARGGLARGMYKDFDPREFMKKHGKEDGDWVES